MEVSQNQITKGIVVVAAVGILFYFTNKKTENFNNQNNTDPTDNGNGNNMISLFNATSIADGLFEAMEGLGGTDEDAIFDLLKTVTQSQFAQVNKAFGRRAYSVTTGTNYTLNPWGNLPLVDLKGWLKSELSILEYQILRRKYPNIL